MGVSDPKGRTDHGAAPSRAGGDHRLADLAERLSAARRGGDPAPEDIERLVGLLSRNDIDPGERLSRAVESLARWAEDEKPAPPAAGAHPAPSEPLPNQPAPRDELEDRLSDFARSLSSLPTSRARPEQTPQIPSKPQHEVQPYAAALAPAASLRAALAEIAARQQSLDDEEEPAAPPKTASREPSRTSVAPGLLSELRSELDALGRSVSELPTRREIDGLTREMTTLAAKLGDDRPAQIDTASLQAIDALVSEVDRMRSDAASPQAIANLSEELNAITARLDVLGPRNATAIEDLARRIDDVRAELDQFPRVSAVDGVAAEIQSVIARLEAQEKAAAPTREAVDGLTGRVQALDGKIVAIAEAASARDDVFRRNNDAIRVELDSMPRAAAVSDLGRQIDALTEGLKNRSAIGPALKAVEGLAGKVDALDGRFAAAVRPDSFDVLGRQIDALHQSVATRGPDPISGAVEALTGKLDALGDRMETMTSATRTRGAAFERIEDSIRTIADQLLASSTGQVPGAMLEMEASKVIERLESTDGRIDDLNAAFAGLASRIERSCADLGTQAVQTAVAAARDTLASIPDGGLDDEISQALTEMRLSATQSERRAADALEGVRSTLDKLLDRMERIGSVPATHVSTEPMLARGDAMARSPIAAEEVNREPIAQEPVARVPISREPAVQDAIVKEPRRRVSEPVMDPDEAIRVTSRRGAAEIETAETPADRSPYADLAPDHPLEPGARPALGGQQTAASFIAAARRAALQSTPEPAAEPVAKPNSDRRSFVSGAISALKARRRSLLLGIAATLIVFAALYVASGMTGTPTEPEPEANPAAPQTGLAPTYQPKIAERDAEDLQTATAGDRAAAEADLNPDIPRRQATTFERGDAASGAGDRADGPAVEDVATPTPAAAKAADPAAPAPKSVSELAPPRAPARDLTNFAFSNGAGVKPRARDWQAGEPVTTGSLSRTADGQLPTEIGGPTLRSRATDGDAAAQLEVADRLLDGRKVEADPVAAAKWLEKAASQNLAPAQQRLGSLYEKGRGVPRDVQAARRWYEQAAASGNVRAMHNLGVMHAEGGLGKPDYSAAVVWFRMASERGLVDSQYNLAVLNARGLGGKRDLVGAYKWFSLAAEQGDADSSAKRDDIGKALGATLPVAKAEVASFRARDVDASANDAPPPPAGGWDRIAERKDAAANVR